MDPNSSVLKRLWCIVVFGLFYILQKKNNKKTDTPICMYPTLRKIHGSAGSNCKQKYFFMPGLALLYIQGTLSDKIFLR